MNDSPSRTTDRDEVVDEMTKAVWPAGKWSAEAAVMLDVVIDFLVETVDEIQGVEVNLSPASGLWLHTPAQVRAWLRRLHSEGMPL